MATSFKIYGALLLAAQALVVKFFWSRALLPSTGYLVCSVLLNLATMLGFQLFKTDGRHKTNVVPYDRMLLVALASALLIVAVLNVLSALPLTVPISPLDRAAFVTIICFMFQILLFNLIRMARHKLSAAGCGMKLSRGRTASASLTFVLFTYGLGAPAFAGLFASMVAYVRRGDDLSPNLQPPAIGLLLISLSALFFARLLSINFGANARAWRRGQLLRFVFPVLVLTVISEMTLRGNWYLWILSFITFVGTLLGISRISWEFQSDDCRLITKADIVLS